jgi:hypothetical protein
VTDSSSSAPAELAGLTLEACEWLPSGADTGLLRVRGRWTVDPPDGELPSLWVRAGGASHRFDSLPDTRFARGPGVWRGTYLVPTRLMADGPDELWLAWGSGPRVALPRPSSDWEPPPMPGPGFADEAQEGPGGELIDRAVLADRRARRAEASEREQSRVAAEAMRALEVLALRSAELERRLEALQRERDELATRAPTPSSEPVDASCSEPADGSSSEPAGAPSSAVAHPTSSGAAEPPTSSGAAHSAPSVDLAAARAAAQAAEQQATHSRAALSSALGAAARVRGQAREWRLHLRTSELVRTGEAVRLAVLEAESAASRTLRDELAAERRERAVQSEAFAAERERAELALAAARDEAAEAVAALQRARLELDARVAEAAAAEAEVRGALETTQGALVDRERELGELRTELERSAAAVVDADARGTALEQRLAALDAALAEERGALAAARTELETARAELVAAESLRHAEAVARAALDEQLDRERAARDALAAALDEQRAEAPDLRAELEAAATHAAELDAARAEAAAQTAELAAELEAARDAAAAQTAELDAARADLTAARRAHEADRARIATLEANLAAERSRRATVEEELAAARAVADRQTGSLTARIAELDRRAAGLAGELELQRRAREQAEAAARVARPEPERAHRLAADLDAAAAALRERVPALEEGEHAAPSGEGAAQAPPTGAAEAPPEGAAEAPPTGVVETPPTAATQPSAPEGAVSPARAASETAGAPGHPRAGHRLRGALVRLAREDPVTAGRILAALLPAQSAVLRRDAEYDLTIHEVGTFAVTVTNGRAWIRRVEAPRGRRAAEFHLSADARAVAELLAGGEPRLRRFSGPQRVSGRRRRAYPVLTALANARLSLKDVARAGARLDADLLMPALPHAIDPAWTRGHTFTVEHRIGDASWFLVARDAGGVSVTRTHPEHAPDAVVTVSAEGFQRLVRDEPAPPGERPVVRGDRVAVALLKSWMDRAQG